MNENQICSLCMEGNSEQALSHAMACRMSCAGSYLCFTKLLTTRQGFASIVKIDDIRQRF